MRIILVAIAFGVLAAPALSFVAKGEIKHLAWQKDVDGLVVACDKELEAWIAAYQVHHSVPADQRDRKNALLNIQSKMNHIVEYRDAKMHRDTSFYEGMLRSQAAATDSLLVAENAAMICLKRARVKQLGG